MIRVLHVIAALDIAQGGPSYSVPRLCGSVAAIGAEVELVSVRGPDGWECAGQGGYRERRFRGNFSQLPILRKLRWSTGLARALRTSVLRVDVIHDHGLWLMPNVQAGWASRGAQKPLVVSPRGMLAPEALAFSHLKKRAFWFLLQGNVVRNAACLHVTSEQEYAEIRAFGLDNPVAIIPNGIDVPNLPTILGEPSAGRTVLSLGRLHPKKGLDRLVRAWAQVEATHPDWWLRIVGPSEQGYERSLRTLAVELGLVRISIEGAIYGEDKVAAYRDADVFVLSTLNENFALTVAEALAAGTPVISTKGAPWQALEGEGCGWWIDHGIEPLARALDRALEMPRPALEAMGARGRAWMKRDFSWDRVGGDMMAVYEWLVRGAEPPDTVRFD